MRICFAQERPIYPLFLGGAEISMHETLRALASMGHSCLALGHLDGRVEELAGWLEQNEGRIERKDCEIRSSQYVSRIPKELVVTADVGYEARMTFLSDFWRFLERALEEFEPDLVFSQLHGSERVISASTAKGAQAVHIVRDLHNPHNFLPFRSDLFQRQCFATLTTSEYMVQRLRVEHGLSATILAPAIDCARFAGLNPAKEGRVVMFNPIRSKGGEIVKSLIRNFPAVDFMLIDGWERIRSADWPFENVVLENRTQQIEQLLAHARLVLVPSQAAEAFCRVGVEAQAAGVPVLASNHSGLIESLGGAARFVSDYSCAEAWTGELSELLVSPDELERMSEAGRANSRRYDKEFHIGRLSEILELLRSGICPL